MITPADEEGICSNASQLCMVWMNEDLANVTFQSSRRACFEGVLI
jgi:hypothetical protein